MSRFLTAAVLLIAPATALAAPTFPMYFLGTMTDAGLGLFTGAITGDVWVNDPDGVKPYSGNIRLEFVVQGTPTQMDGTWSFSRGTFSCAVPDQEIRDAFGPLMPPGTDIKNATCNGIWNGPIKCIEGDINGNVSLFGIPLGNQVVANYTMCR